MRVLQISKLFLGAIIWIFVYPANSTSLAFVEAETTEQHIEIVFSELRVLKPMMAGEKYTVSVAGKEETRGKEQFLRRRTAQEISNSGLSSGCGDHAILFVKRIERLGF